MDFNYQSPGWNVEGTEPPDTMKSTGFQPGYKPASSYFNFSWTRVSKCITELQSKLSGLTKADVGLDQVDNTADSGKSVKYASTAGTADKTKASFVVKLNGGTTEDSDMYTFTGATAKTVNITPAKIGAVADSGGTLKGALVANSTSSADLSTTQMRNISAGTSELTAGTSTLATGNIYVMYE